MKFLIDAKVYAKVMYLVGKCDKEISGLGKAKIEGDTVRITEMFLLEQECTGTTTDLDAGAVSKALYDAHISPAEGELLWWWHSHVDMQVFWSGTDMATIREFGANGRFFATVFNKKAEMRSAYYQAGNGQFPQVFVDAIETKIDFGLTQEEVADLDKQYTEKVKIKKWTMPKSYTGYPQNTLMGEMEEKIAARKSELLSKFEQRKSVMLDNKYKDPFWWDDDDFYGDQMPAAFFEEDYFTDIQKPVGMAATRKPKTIKRKGGKNGNK